MRRILIALQRFFQGCSRVSKIAIIRIVAAIKAFIAWISPPRRFFAALLGLVFIVSLLSWVIWDSRSAFVLYFPTIANKTTLRGEVRDLPNRSSAEGRAEILTSEFLLGPHDPMLIPALPPGSRLESVILRKSSLFVDLGEDAALVAGPDLEVALKALRMTLSLAIHQAKKIVITIGGREPWSEGISLGGTGQKSSEKN